MNGKAITKQAILEALRAQDAPIPSIELRLEETGALQPSGQPDGILHVRWRDSAATFVFELRTRSTPKEIQAAISQAQHYARLMGLEPMIVVPYLAEDRLSELEGARVSGIDLCGNAIIAVPGMSVFRSGQPNRYREPTALRNPFGGDTSIFARCFLLRASFESLTHLRDFAGERVMPGGRRDRTGPPSLGTASKVVAALTEDLVVAKEGTAIRLVDSERLLVLLSAGIGRSRSPVMVGETPHTTERLWDLLTKAQDRGILRSVATGAGSAARYHVLADDGRLSIYVDSVESAMNLLDVRETQAFPTIELIEDTHNLVYFDARRVGDASWASPVQTWVELDAGGPRERDAANQLRSLLRSGQAIVPS